MDRNEFLRLSLAKSKELQAHWKNTRRVFKAFQSSPSNSRFHNLGVLFESLTAWIERGIRLTVVRHFLVLPTEMLIARLFALTTHREELHDSYEAYLMWVESIILRDLADPSDSLGVVHGASGEPSAELQQRFNELPMSDRALLYLYMVEKNSLSEVAKRTKIPNKEVARKIERVWRIVSAGNPELELPIGWHSPKQLRHDGTLEVQEEVKEQDQSAPDDPEDQS